MSSWTTPITWAASTLTSTQMNAEIRDHANFLKGALDTLTASTTADTSDTMNLWIKRSTAAGSAYSSSVTADANARLTIRADGYMGWGSGAAAADVTLQRNAVGTLRLDGFLPIYGTGANLVLAGTVAGDASYRFSVLADGTARWGDGTAAPDTNLYRSAANTLQTDDNFTLNGLVALTMNNGLSLNGNGFVGLTEVSPTVNGGANTARIYAVDNGAGKTQLGVIFNTGAFQVMATQP